MVTQATLPLLLIITITFTITTTVRKEQEQEQGEQRDWYIFRNNNNIREWNQRQRWW